MLSVDGAVEVEDVAAEDVAEADELPPVAAEAAVPVHRCLAPKVDHRFHAPKQVSRARVALVLALTVQRVARTSIRRKAVPTSVVRRHAPVVD